ncbi:helix-turn-helix transcriptional regulator [Amycolatopsis sp. NPDC005232]|uniref:helix-turn-helix domain-containing protein n=1 Tax=Amycolatopsis sp. NPDC005232 TaxID=3157027 RepID=UPI0033AC647F
MANAPSLRRRRLVGALKRLRLDAGMTLAEAGEAAGFSEAKVSRIETFRFQVSGDDTYALAKALGASEETANALVKLARSAKQRGWWHDAAGEDNGLGTFADFLELESDAREIFEFQETLIPGRLQTAGYAAAVIRADLPNATHAEVERRVKLRLDRQSQSSAPLWAVIFEAALDMPVGGPEVMCEQLDRLSEAAKRPGIQVQVLPKRSRGHAAIGTSFTLFELADGATFAHIDTLTGGLLIEDPAQVEIYRKARMGLQAAAADFAGSDTLVKRARDNHRSTP